MAGAPPPYSAQPPYNPTYPANPGYPSYPDPNAGKNYAGYPPQPGPPQPGPPPPGFQPGYYPPPQPQPAVIHAPPRQPVQSTTTVVVTGPPAVVATGNCPNCRPGMVGPFDMQFKHLLPVGYLSEDFTCCGICLAIFCFPIGLICCLLMRDKRCTHCGSHY